MSSAAWLIWYGADQRGRRLHAESCPVVQSKWTSISARIHSMYSVHLSAILFALASMTSQRFCNRQITYAVGFYLSVLSTRGISFTPRRSLPLTFGRFSKRFSSPGRFLTVATSARNRPYFEALSSYGKTPVSWSRGGVMRHRQNSVSGMSTEFPAAAGQPQQA